MKRPVLAGLAVAGIAVGVLVAWWWGHTPRKSPDKQRVTTDVGIPSRAPARGAELGAGDAIASVLVDDDPVGTLRLEGQVIDDGDDPVGGATVILGSHPPRSTVTEGDGTFAFDRLVGRPYTLVARAPGGVAGPVTLRLTSRPEPVILQLRPAGAVVVTVTGPKGPVPGATVELRGLDTQNGSTAADGVARFPVVLPGAYEVVAWSTGLARAQAHARVGATGTTAVALVLRPGAPVEGVVRAADGRPVEGARVVWVGASDWGLSGDERRDAVLSARDGTYRIEAMPPGSFRFVARHPAHASGSSPILTLDGATARTGVDIALGAGATVRGKVVATCEGGARASGRSSGGAAPPRGAACDVPVSGARVRIAVEAPFAFGEGPRQAYTDDRGVFAIAGLPRRALLALAVSEAGSSSAVAVDATAGDVDDVVLRLDQTGTIAGVVVDPTGEPLEGVQVSAGPDFDGSSDRGQLAQWRLRGFPQELTDAAGKFTLTGLAPGGYRVRATRARAASRGRAWAGEGTVARTGTTNLKLVLEAEGAIKGVVAFADGSAPDAFVVSIGFAQESFLGTGGAFVVDGLAPGPARIAVRGPAIDGKLVEVTVVAGKTADAGTITVSKGRMIAGTVVAAGRPVPGATVYAGRQIIGSGSSSKAQQLGPFQRGTKETTTDEAGKFALTGFGPGDIAIVAEHADLGRSRSLRLIAGDPAASQLVLQLEPFGALSGTLRQGGQPADGIGVTVQSITTPGLLYTVASAPDGTFRFDRLAPDTYKVSATLGMPMIGMRFYSKQVAVVSGQETKVELAVEKGAVALAVTPKPKSGTLRVVSVIVASGTFASANARDLQLRMSAAGPGASQWQVLTNGGTATFQELLPGGYTACAVPLPSEIQGMAAIAYVDRHGDTLPAYCKQVAVAASPASQAAEVAVEIPPVATEE